MSGDAVAASVFYGATASPDTVIVLVTIPTVTADGNGNYAPGFYVVTIRAESRTLTIPAEDRTTTVHADDRTLTVDTDDRTLTIRSEARTLEVPDGS